MPEENNQNNTQPLITPNHSQLPKNNVPPKTFSSPKTTAGTSNTPSIKFPPLLWKDTQELLANIEKKLGGAVISYYGSNMMVGDDVKYFYTHLRNIGHRDKLFFVLFSSGGDGQSAYRIASVLKSYCEELIIVVPEKAASAATMLSLAGDKIIMTPLSFLTAVDTSITHPLNPRDRDNFPVKVELEEIRRAVEVLAKAKGGGGDNSDIYKTIFNYIHPVAFGCMERTSTLSEMLCRDILSLRKNPPDSDTADKIIFKLNHEYPAHSYPITREKAKILGIPVENSDPEMDNLLWRFINVNRVLTEPARTDINDSYFHKENYLTSIESVGRRIMVRQVLERRLDPIIKGWTTLKEEYKWEALYEAEDNGQKKLMITSLEF